ncbi:MAG: hypothetical protein HFE75_05025 [Firmicutes bacterium]|jgi:hypothetical protein|nr:hypothetical protein [Bacillota bacterium]
MIKEALQYIVGLNKPELVEVGGETYSDKNLHRVNHNPKAVELRLKTLTSLIDYIESGADEMADKMILHVESPELVWLTSKLDEDRDRETLIQAVAEIPGFDFGRFIPHEEFCVALRSRFIETEDQKLLLKFAGTVEAGTVAQYSDDGVTQKATVKTGIASKGDAVVPGLVTLKPYRTFINLEQPESQFLFRMRDGRDGVECALFEADGGAWRDEARASVHGYLEGAIAKMGKRERFIVIS